MTYLYKELKRGEDKIEEELVSLVDFLNFYSKLKWPCKQFNVGRRAGVQENTNFLTAYVV